MALAGRNFVPFPLHYHRKVETLTGSQRSWWEVKICQSRMDKNVAVSGGQARLKVAWGEHHQGGNSVLDLGAGGAAVRFLSFFFFWNHALHVRVFMETLWLAEMERMRSKPKWEIRAVSPKLGWQSWNSCDSPSGWSWPKLSYKNKTPWSTWTCNDTSQYGIVEPI